MYSFLGNFEFFMRQKSYHKHLGIVNGDWFRNVIWYLTHANMRSPLKPVIIKFKFLIFIHKIYLF